MLLIPSPELLRIIIITVDRSGIALMFFIWELYVYFSSYLSSTFLLVDLRLRSFESQEGEMGRKEGNHFRASIRSSSLLAYSIFPPPSPPSFPFLSSFSIVNKSCTLHIKPISQSGQVTCSGQDSNPDLLIPNSIFLITSKSI